MQLGWKESQTGALRQKLDKGGEKKSFTCGLEKLTEFKNRPPHMDSIIFCALKDMRKSSGLMEVEFPRMRLQAKENAIQKKCERRKMRRLSRKCPVTLEDAKAMGGAKFEIASREEMPERIRTERCSVLSKTFFQQLKNEERSCFEPVIEEPKIVKVWGNSRKPRK